MGRVTAPHQPERPSSQTTAAKEAPAKPQPPLPAWALASHSHECAQWGSRGLGTQAESSSTLVQPGGVPFSLSTLFLAMESKTQAPGPPKHHHHACPGLAHGPCSPYPLQIRFHIPSGLQGPVLGQALPWECPSDRCFSLWWVVA